MSETNLQTGTVMRRKENLYEENVKLIWKYEN